QKTCPGTAVGIQRQGRLQQLRVFVRVKCSKQPFEFAPDGKGKPNLLGVLLSFVILVDRDGCAVKWAEIHGVRHSVDAISADGRQIDPTQFSLQGRVIDLELPI